MLGAFTGGATVPGGTVGTNDEDTRAGGEGAGKAAAAAAELGRTGPKTEAATTGRARRPAPEEVEWEEPVEAAEPWDVATLDAAASKAGAATPREAGRPTLEEEERPAGTGGEFSVPGAPEVPATRAVRAARATRDAAASSQSAARWPAL
jgi:hypothetical protein